jgi:hypothetical protein
MQILVSDSAFEKFKQDMGIPVNVIDPWSSPRQNSTNEQVLPF